MSEPMSDFQSLSHAELVQLCQAFWQELQTLTKRIERLEAENQALKANSAKIKKTSLNSSTPPSKDQKVNLELPTTLKQPRQASLGRAGGGRPLHQNPDFEQSLRPDVCRHCGSFLLGALDVVHAVYDKIELPTIKPVVTRVTQLACTCQTCHKITIAIPPVGLEPGTPFGVSVQSLVLSLRFGHAISYARLQGVLNEVFAVKISQGGINKTTVLNPGKSKVFHSLEQGFLLR